MSPDPTPATRIALRAYPPSFRARYGAELAALAEDLGPSWRRTAGLYAGAVRAWLRPAFTGPDATRHRLEATVSTVWMAWCAGFLVAPAMTKALQDPPGPHAHAAVRGLLDAATVVLAAGWAVALAGVALIGWRALRPALHARQWSVLRPLLPAACLGPASAVTLVVLAVASRSDAPHPTVAAIALGSAWLVLTLAFLASGGVGPGVSVRRLHPGTAVLRVPTMLAAALALCLAVLTATSTAAVLVAGDATLVGAVVPVVVVLAVAAVASAAAVVSSARGVLALRARA